MDIDLFNNQIESQLLTNVQHIKLSIPRDVYLHYFGGMFTAVQEVMGRLCGRYGLEMKATDKDRGIYYNDKESELILKNNQPTAIVIELKRDLDNPIYHKKLKELQDRHGTRFIQA